MLAWRSSVYVIVHSLSSLSLSLSLSLSFFLSFFLFLSLSLPLPRAAGYVNIDAGAVSDAFLLFLLILSSSYSPSSSIYSSFFTLLVPPSFFFFFFFSLTPLIFLSLLLFSHPTLSSRKFTPMAPRHFLSPPKNAHANYWRTARWGERREQGEGREKVRSIYKKKKKTKKRRSRTIREKRKWRAIKIKKPFLSISPSHTCSN